MRCVDDIVEPRAAPDCSTWRGIAFEDIVSHLARGGLLDVIERPDQRQYPGHGSATEDAEQEHR
jgi:hypothetical protein